MKLNLPNIFTGCNLFSGCIASIMVFRNHLDIAAYFVFLAAFFDLLDGMAARKGSCGSQFGKELDSLADVISFGYVPGAILFKLLQLSDMNLYFHSEILIRVLQFFPFVVTVFSAFRLAKFNIDTRQTDDFIGLATPANTLLIVSLPLILKQFPGIYDGLILHPYFNFILVACSSYLLVSEIKMFSLKFKSFGIKDNFYQYLIILISLLLFPFLLFAAIPVLIVLYILLSILKNLLNKNSNNEIHS